MPPPHLFMQQTQSREALLMADGDDDGDDRQFSDDDDDDDEHSPLHRPGDGGNADIYGGSQRSSFDTKGWDVFRVLPPETDSGSMAQKKCLDLSVRILKVLAYALTFLVVLGAGVITKTCLLLVTSQLKANRKLPYCNSKLRNDKSLFSSMGDVDRVAWVWVLVLVFAVPEMGTLLRAARICIFKSYRRPPIGDFFVLFLGEMAHTVGLAMFVYAILPQLDVVRGAMLTNCVCFVPGLFGLMSRQKGESGRFLKVIVDLISIVTQVSAFILWPSLENPNRPNQSHYTLWLLPLALILTSAVWWENYVDKNSPIGFISRLGRVKERLLLTRYFCYLLVAPLKILLFFACTAIFVYSDSEDVGSLFTKFTESFGAHKYNVSEVDQLLSIQSDIPNHAQKFSFSLNEKTWPNVAVYVGIVMGVSAYLCYIFGKFACKICIQGFSLAFPVSLTIPVTISLLISACGIRNENPCAFENLFPDYLFYECPSGNFLIDFISNDFAWVWLLWLLSQTWITLHIWTPKCERLASTEKLFVAPMYNAFLVDQSMALNRRRDDEGDLKTEDLELEAGVGTGDEPEMTSQYYETISVATEGTKSGSASTKSTDHITRIYVCATMWHETKEEMIEMLKSIFRMDEDQCARRNAQKYLKIVDPDYYEFETHIFFDDAFEDPDDGLEGDRIVNRFVKLLVSVVDEAASCVHQTNIKLRPPKKYPAPYGGRLMWTLPGKTKMIAHLKDKDKIRHRKRWSQVMYMYYLLGHRLMEQPTSVDRKEILAENTYLLTLDGDIDFQPHAVQLLVDLMKKNRNLGAACGRIHPVGSGPMVWYQMFEYAIGHWLQKATEHMIGCVLCSPGCFSLFRGKALMDHNVMRKYTTKSDEPRHYVQYDQGEDRWLCTLLLQRGYRVEYSAASDAYTHCPEGFSEFYNQRRRWVPSTMANIMDLLMDYKRTVRINDNISMPYIAYQMMLMAGTILGPGTIFLMLVGAFVAAFNIDNWTSFYYNIIPILFFMIVCFTCNSNIQLMIAQLISTIYALVMMAVLVGMVIEMQEDGLASPTTMMFLFLILVFLVTGLLHPQEVWCLVHGILYFCVIPSMYLLLMIYALFNMDNVTWGTRETQSNKKKSKKEIEAEKREAEEAKKMARSKGILGFINGIGVSGVEEEGSIEFSLANLFRCMCCTHPKPNDEAIQLAKIAESLAIINKRIGVLEKAADPHGQLGIRRRSMSSVRGPGIDLNSVPEDCEDDMFDHDDHSEHSTVSADNNRHTDRNFLINPLWIEDRDLKRGEVDYLSGPETAFWTDLIAKYLYPIDENKEEQKRMAFELRNLRNEAIFTFCMLNALFVTVAFLLQLHADTIYIQWPLGITYNVTFDDTTGTPEVIISKKYLQLEPIGLVFVFFFALILIIQFVAMFFHRFGTLSHILASIDIFCCNRKVEDLSEEAFIDNNAVEIVKNLQKLRGLNDDGDSSSDAYGAHGPGIPGQPGRRPGGGGGPWGVPGGDRLARRRTIHQLEKTKQRKSKAIGTLDVAFRQRFFNLNAEAAAAGADGTPILGDHPLRKLSMRRETMKALESRRNSVLNGDRRRSHMQTLGASNDVNRKRASVASLACVVNEGGNPTGVGGGSRSRASINGVVFAPQGGVANQAYDASDGEDRSSLRMQNLTGGLPRRSSHM